MEIKQKSAWDKLSMQEKAQLIKLSVNNGVSSLKQIRDTYNLYSSGGDLGAYNTFVETLPDNMKYTDPAKYDMYRYWELNGRPKDFEEAKKKEMFHKESDGYYHASTLAEVTNSPDKHYGTLEFIKAKNHNTIGLEVGAYLKDKNHPMRNKEYILDYTEDKARYRPRTYAESILPEGAYVGTIPVTAQYANGGNLSHKKSGKEQGESSWLNNGYKSSNDWQLQMRMKTNQMLQNLQNSPFYMTDQEMQNLEFARMNEAISNNPSKEFVTYVGFDNNGNEIPKKIPTSEGLNTMWDAGIIDYMPVLGDGKQMLDIIGATKNNDYLTAGLLGGMMFIPNIIEKPLKSLKTYAKNATNRALESVLRIGDVFADNPFTFARQMLGNKGSGLRYVLTGQPQLAYQMPYRYSGQVLWSPDNTVAESAHIGDLIDVIMGKSNVLLDEYGNTLGRLTDDITNIPDKTIAAFQSLPGKSDVLPKVLKFDQSALSPEFIPKPDIQQLIDMPLNIPMEIGRRTRPRVPILQGGRTVSIVDPGHYGLTALKTDNGLQLFGHDVYHYTPKNVKQTNFSASWMPNIPITVGNPFVVEWQVPELIYDASRLNSQSLLQLLPYSNVKPSNVKHLFNIKEFVANKTSKLSTGGPLYPFSFEKNPFLKTPVVRYDEGGHLYGFGDWLTNLFSPSDTTITTVNTEPAPLDLGELATRQAYAESRFDSNAVSPANAIGLFQVTPNTLAYYNSKTGNTFTTQDLYDDTINQQVRDWYMNDLMNRPWNTKNNPSDSVQYAKSLGAYNWGPTNLVDTLNKAKADGVDIYNSWDWLAYLPTETRDYINFILRNQNNSAHRNNMMYNRSVDKYDSKVSAIKSNK